jgi:hypothetical protein
MSLVTPRRSGESRKPCWFFFGCLGLPRKSIPAFIWTMARGDALPLALYTPNRRNNNAVSCNGNPITPD